MKQFQDLWIFSLIALEQTQALSNPDPATTQSLLQLINDPDPHIQAQVVALLNSVNTLKSFQKICDEWEFERNHELERILQTSTIQPPLLPRTNTLVYFLRQDLEHQPLKQADMISTLVGFLLNEEPRFQEIAAFLLRSLDEQASIDQFCSHWAASRDPHLEDLLIQAQYTASTPELLRLLTRLKVNKQVQRLKFTADKVSHLINFLQDSDPQIASQAKSLLTHLSLPEAQNALLEFYIHETPAFLTPIIQQIAFKPQRRDLLAMAFFMAEDWQNYETIDFTQQYLSLYFSNAPDPTRKKILFKLQRCGKPHYTAILFPKGPAAQQTILSPAETETSIALLQQYQNWQALWELCQNTYLDLSLQIFQILKHTAWKPQDPAEQQVFGELSELALPAARPSLDTVMESIPFAVPISVLKFKGRINAVAFAPHQKLLAMAANQRAVLLWNYQQGKAEQLIQGFNHSVGLLAYSQDEQLFIGEKTNGQDYCDLWRWSDQSLSLIGFHQGSITSINPIDDNLVVTTGKDQRLVAWNISAKAVQHEAKLNWWPRASIYLPDNHSIRLYNRTPVEYSLPALKPQPQKTIESHHLVRDSVERAICLTAYPQQRLIGQFNGQVVLSKPSQNRSYYQQQLVHTLPSHLIGLNSTTNQDEFLAIGNNGEIERFDLSGHARPLQHTMPGPFTSFQISPDRSLFATGTKTAHTILWDFRPNQVRHFLKRPLSEISNHHWAVLKFIQTHSKLDPTIRTILSYCNRILEHRYQFDIELDAIDALSPGEYDIELEQIYGE